MGCGIFIARDEGAFASAYCKTLDPKEPERKSLSFSVSAQEVVMAYEANTLGTNDIDHWSIRLLRETSLIGDIHMLDRVMRTFPQVRSGICSVPSFAVRVVLGCPEAISVLFSSS